MTPEIIELNTSTVKLVVEKVFSNSWWPNLISSFAGAFFAFSFIKVADVLNRIATRKKMNYNALVQLEYIGNENLSITYDNIFVAKDIIKTSKQTISQREIHINFNNFNNLVIKNEQLTELLNIEFINQCLGLNLHARKINHSLESISKFYNQINQGIFQRSLPIEVYFENLRGVIEHLSQIINFLENFMAETIEMIATAKVLIEKEKPIFTKFFTGVYKNKPLSDFETEIRKEMKKLNSQIQTISRNDRERIDKILKKESPTERASKLK